MPAPLGPFVRCWFSVLWLAFFGFSRTGELEALPRAFVQLTLLVSVTHAHTQRETTNVFVKKLVGASLSVCTLHFVPFYF